MAKKRNPNDSTLRNIQAANKRIKVLDRRIDAISARVAHVEMGQRLIRAAINLEAKRTLVAKRKAAKRR